MLAKDCCIVLALRLSNMILCQAWRMWGFHSHARPNLSAFEAHDAVFNFDRLLDECAIRPGMHPEGFLRKGLREIVQTPYPPSKLARLFNIPLRCSLPLAGVPQIQAPPAS